MKRLLVISGIVVAVLLLIVVLAPIFINVDSFRPELEKKLSAALNRSVHIGKLDASILSGGASASDISIADDPAFNKGPFLRASAVKIGVKLMPLIVSKQLKVTSITVQKPEITLLKNAAGKWNYSTLGAGKQQNSSESSGKSPEISVDKFEIADGTVRVGDSGGHARGKESVYQNVNLTARNISATTAMPFTLSAGLPAGGKLELEGQAGPLNPADSAKSPLDAKITLKHVDLGATGFVDPSSGLGGILDFDGQAKSDGHRVHSEGKGTANGLKVVKGAQPAKQPVALDYKSDYSLDSESGSVNANVHTGNSTTNASGTLSSKGEDTLANLKIHGKDMAVNMDLAAEGPLDRLIINGPLSITGTHLSGYNLTSKLGALAPFTGNKSGSMDTLIQTFSSGLRVAPEGIRADNVVLDVPSLGMLTGNGVIATNNALDFKMLLKLSGSANSVLGSLTGISTSAQSKGLPFLIQGTTSNPVFRPALGEAMKGDLQNSLMQALQGNKNADKKDIQTQGQEKQDLKGVLGGLLNKNKKKPQ
jgi:AsmA protein